MFKLILPIILLLLSFISSSFSQVKIYLHQPDCEIKTVVRIANLPENKSTTIDKDTEMFIVDSPDEPKSLTFFIDTVGMMLEKIWIEPSSERIDIYLYNCRQYIFYVDMPNDLTREGRASIYYGKFLSEQSESREEFIKAYNEYKVNYIRENPESFLSLDAFERMNISDEKKKKLLETIGNKNKEYPLYKKLLKKYNTKVNLDSLSLNLSFCSINKDTFHFESFKNKPVVFSFWMSGCKWSTNLLPEIVSLNEDNKDIAFVYYCLDQNMDQWSNSSEKFNIPEERNISELSGFLGELPSLFGVDRTPFFVVVDKNQKIVLVTFGDELYLVKKEIQNFR